MLQFGRFDPSLTYRPRSGAYGVLWREDRVALVQVENEFDLPGGGIEAGESPEAALYREFLEETGLKVGQARLIIEMHHYYIHANGQAYNNHCHFYEVQYQGSDPSQKVEMDHELVWLDPLAALKCLKNEGYAWALTLCLRNAFQERLEPALS